MELRKLIEELSTALYDAMCEGNEDEESYSAMVDTPNGYIDVWYGIKKGDWELEIYIYHDDEDNDHETPNLEAYLADKIDVDWDSVREYWRDYNMDEYQRNGFASEADFWHWKEGR